MISKFQRLIAAAGLLACWASAHAYIDPGTGSALVGAIVAAFGAVVAFVKLYWHRFTRLFSREESEEAPQQRQPDTDES